MAARNGVQSLPGCVIAETIDSFRNWRLDAGRRGTIGLVTTMGALHEGHLTLVRQAKSECAQVIVTIFVNPLQFGPNEDFSKYPRTLQRDVELLEREGVNIVFHPTTAEIYPNGQKDELTTVAPPSSLIATMEGAFRPGHFLGVATVVAKLFNIVQPDVAYFGEKDYQQLLVVRRMVTDLNMPLRIAAVPTVREADGLALSSRNVYLTPEQRKVAPTLQKALCQVRDAIVSGASPAQALSSGRALVNNTPGFTLQYLEVCHAETLAPCQTAVAPMVILIAARLGEVRLIDNIVVR